MIESKRGTYPRIACYVAEYVAGISCLDFFQDSTYPQAEKEKQAARLASLLRKMSDLYVSHGDLKASNIVMSQDGPVLLDLDAMRQYTSLARFKKSGDRDLQRFLLNWENKQDIYEMFIRQMKHRGLCP